MIIVAHVSRHRDNERNANIGGGRKRNGKRASRVIKRNGHRITTKNSKSKNDNDCKNSLEAHAGTTCAAGISLAESCSSEAIPPAGAILCNTVPGFGKPRTTKPCTPKP